MQKFRLSYDRLFNAWPPFTHNERVVDGSGVFLTFRFFKDNKEVLFENGADVPVTDKVVCTVNKENGVLLKIKAFEKEPWFDCFTCAVTGYYLSVYEGTSKECMPGCPKEFEDYPVSANSDVSKEEFLEVVQSYWENFDNTDNYEAQCTCMDYVEVG